MCIHHPSSSSLHPGNDGIVSEGGHIPSITNAKEMLSTSQTVRQHLEHDCQSEVSIRGKKEKEKVVISRHKPVQRVNSLRMMLLTWNLGETSPPAEDCKFISEMAAHNDVDIVCLAVQEVENIKPRRHEGRRSREWKRLQWKALGHSVSNLFVESCPIFSMRKKLFVLFIFCPNSIYIIQFVRVGHRTMGAMQLSIFIRRNLVPRVRLMKMKDVACGVGNVLQNKGAVACFLR